MALFSNYMTRIRLNKALPYVKGSVLDLGCGDARVLEYLANKIELYYGIEHTQQWIDKLKKRYPKNNFLCLDLDEDGLDIDTKFDTVLLLAIIEHIYNQKHLAKEILKKLKPDGKIIITTPTPFGDWIHRMGSKFGLFAKSADDHHPVIYNKHRFGVLAKHFNLKIEKYKLFEFGCNQLVILTRIPQRNNQ